jgi:hypothetical protein
VKVLIIGAKTKETMNKRRNYATFILKRNKATEVGKQTCEGGLSIDGSFGNTILTRNADIKKGKCGTRFNFTSEFNIRVLAI